MELIYVSTLLCWKKELHGVKEMIRYGWTDRAYLNLLTKICQNLLILDTEFAKKKLKKWSSSARSSPTWPLIIWQRFCHQSLPTMVIIFGKISIPSVLWKSHPHSRAFFQALLSYGTVCHQTYRAQCTSINLFFCNPVEMKWPKNCQWRLKGCCATLSSLFLRPIVTGPIARFNIILCFKFLMLLPTCTKSNGACAHYAMVSKFQWKPFWLATQWDPQNDWTATQNRVNYDIFAQAPLVSNRFQIN